MVAQVKTGYWSSSDDRIKFNEQKLDYGLAQVMALEPKRYYRAEYEYDPETEELVIHPEKMSRTNEIGFVAQDVRQVIPEAVSVPEDENRELWSMSYDTIIPVLIKAIQEQQTQIEELKQEIKTIPAFVARIAAFAYKLFGKKTFLSTEHINRLVRERHYSIKKITAIGWKPAYSTEKAVAATVYELEKQEKSS